MIKELDNTSLEKKMILSSLQESNRKTEQLEQLGKASKAEIKELTRKLEDATSCITDFEGKCQELEMTIRHLQDDKQQMSMSISRREESKHSPTHKQLIMKATEIEEKSKNLHEREKKLHERQRRLSMMEMDLKERENRLAIEVRLKIIQTHKLKELIDENSLLKNELDKMQKEKEGTEKESYEVYLRKINDMQSEIEMLRETTKRMEEEPPRED